MWPYFQDRLHHGVVRRNLGSGWVTGSGRVTLDGCLAKQSSVTPASPPPACSPPSMLPSMLSPRTEPGRPDSARF